MEPITSDSRWSTGCCSKRNIAGDNGLNTPSKKNTNKLFTMSKRRCQFVHNSHFNSRLDSVCKQTIFTGTVQNEMITPHVAMEKKYFVELN